MSKELIIGNKSIHQMKDALDNVKPSKDFATWYFNLRSLIKSKKGEDLVKRLNAHLDTCKDCEEIEFDGLKIKKVVRSGRVYNTSDKLQKLEAKREILAKQLEDLDTDIDAERTKVGFTTEEGAGSYWKAV